MLVPELLDWPGKSDRDGKERPAVHHMLDVAACAELLIDRHNAFSKYSREVRRALVILVALHDVGKLSESFQALIRQKKRGAPLHWKLSDYMLCGTLDKQLKKFGTNRYVRAQLYAAVAGHHGKPPDRSSGNLRENYRRENAVGIAKDFASEWVTILLNLLPDASLEGLTETDAKILSWVLCGLTTVADWIGSNPDWFPIECGPTDFESAFDQSRERALIAVRSSGINPPDLIRPNSDTPLGMSSLRPMQTTCSRFPIGSSPHLVVMEDCTGSGKTEAALILAHRMIDRSLGRGLFFALPTIATSDAMIDRVNRYMGKFFQSPPSVVLTHSRANLSNSFRNLVSASSDETPETTGTVWLTDNRRRSLLATIGVGTIDQALLSVLPTRFSTLRAFGLTDKILIVDEVHSYDPYMQQELEVLLKMHARQGGSAILMTATLPVKTRRAYITAFQSGLDATINSVVCQNYPSLHSISTTIESTAVEPVASSVRRIKIRRLHNVEIAIKLLESSLSAGAICVWVRNAVDDAVDTVQELRKRGIEADLLHARFAMCDRLEREREILSRYGKDRTGENGRILIATQVVEASLDLDFDVMISDLAPIGSLIQRAGRLWRHMDKRPSQARPCPGPTLHVVSPDPEVVLNDHWLAEVLNSGAWIYRLDDQWRTAKVLFDAGEIVEPSGVRDLIEAVHGDNAQDVTDTIDDTKYVGEQLAMVGRAKANLVEIDSGFLDGTKGAVGTDVRFPTRLGIPQILIVLARCIEGRISPWASDEDQPTAWSLSEVSVAKDKFEPLLPKEQIGVKAVRQSWPEWRQRECKLVLVNDDGRIGDKLFYDEYAGLHTNCIQ